MLVEEMSQEDAQGLPSSELDAVENQLKWASWELSSLRHCGEDQNSMGPTFPRVLCLFFGETLLSCYLEIAVCEKREFPGGRLPGLGILYSSALASLAFLS